MTKRSGWFGEPHRHSLSAMGVKTKKLKPKPEEFKAYIKASATLEGLLKLNKQAGDKEWIAEFDMVDGSILINDVRMDGTRDASFLKWDEGVDTKHNVGYIHYHPKHLFPLFTAQDFVLSCRVHDSRENKDIYPMTLMGLVTDNRLIVLGVKPNKRRETEFSMMTAVDGMPRTTKELENMVSEMKKSGELKVMVDMTFDKSNGIEKGLVV